MIADGKIRPLSVLSIDEFEKALAYVSDNDFSWRELLECRFERNTVLRNSVGQTMVDLISAKGIASKQNSALKRKYAEFGDFMRKVFEKTR